MHDVCKVVLRLSGFLEHRARATAEGSEIGSEAMTIRAVICDIGDVLLLRTGESLEAQWERRLGYPKGTLIRRLHESDLIARAYTGQLSDAEVSTELAALFGMNEAQRQQFIAEREQQSRYVPNRALIAFLNSLTPRYRLATLSNDWPGGREYNERHYRLSQILHAEAMLYSYEEGLMKPAAAIYRLACSRLRVEPQEAVFVDNLAASVEGACTAGLAVVLYTSAEQTICDLTQLLMPDGSACAR